MADAQITITANTRQAERALGRLNGSLGSISGAAKVAGAAITALATSRVLTSIVQTTARFQDLRTSLASVAGGAREGAQAFEFINRFATQTQFGVEELTQTYIKLQSSGITPTTELLTTFTDAAAVTTDQLGSLQAITDLFSRTTAGGLGLEELNRLADRGIPVFDILQEKLGRNRLELTDLGKTAEGANIILEALQDGINERFGGATAARINNVSTQFSNLQIAIASAADAVGSQGFAKALGDTAAQITNVITNNKQLVQEIGVRLTQAFLVVRAGIKLVIDNIKFLGLAFAAFIGLGIAKAIVGIAMAFGSTLVRGIVLAGRALKAMTALAMANPFIAAAVVIAGGIEYLTGAFSKLFATITGGSGAEETLEGLKDAMGDLGETVGLNTDSFNEFFAALGASEEEARALAEQANAIAEANSNTANSAGVVTENYQEQADALANVKKSIEEIITDAERQLALATANNEANEVIRALKIAEVDLGRELNAEEEKRLRSLNEQIRLQRKLAELQGNIQKQVDDLVTTTTVELNDAVYELGAAYEAVMADLDDQLAQGVISYRQYERDKFVITQDYENKLYNIRKNAADKYDDLMEASIRRQLQMQNGALSEQQKAFLQRQGQEERQQEIIADRIEFEKKSEAEKAQWAISQGAEVFNQLGKYNKRAFEAAKALNIANAIMNTYTGATKALATYPPPFNYIAAAAVVAAGLAQVAAIRSQSYSGRALGGPVAGQQSYIVGERGPELFTPNTAGRITRNQDLQGGQPVNINFNIQANDAQGFDDLLLQRKGLITQLVSDAITDRGQRSIV